MTRADKSEIKDMEKRATEGEFDGSGSDEINEGWTWLYNTTKWHYFKEGRSLCGKWMVLSKQDYELGNDDSPDNCKTCQKKLAKLKEESL